MNTPKYLLYIGTALIVVSIFWTIITESKKDDLTAQLIEKGLPTPVNADAFKLQEILNMKG